FDTVTCHLLPAEGPGLPWITFFRVLSCSQVLILFLLLTWFPLFFSVTPCLRVSVVNIGFWLWPAPSCPLWWLSSPACKTHAMAAATRSHCSVSLSSWRLPALVSL